MRPPLPASRRCSQPQSRSAKRTVSSLLSPIRQCDSREGLPILRKLRNSVQRLQARVPFRPTHQQCAFIVRAACRCLAFLSTDRVRTQKLVPAQQSSPRGVQTACAFAGALVQCLRAIPWSTALRVHNCNRVASRVPLAGYAGFRVRSSRADPSGTDRLCTRQIIDGAPRTRAVGQPQHCRWLIPRSSQ